MLALCRFPISSENERTLSFAMGNPMGQAEEWKILAEEAAQEQDPEKLMQIIEALTAALAEKDVRKNGNRNQQNAA